MLTYHDREFLQLLAKRVQGDSTDRFIDWLYEVSALLIVLGPMEAILCAAEAKNGRAMTVLFYVGLSTPVIGLMILWWADTWKRRRE